LLHEVAPSAAIIGVLINPNYQEAGAQSREVQEASRTIGRQVQIVSAGNDQELEAAFATFIQQRVDALLVSADPFFDTRRERIVALAAQFKLPAIYQFRDFARAGGLMSYGISIADGYRQVGIYTAQVLKGAKPADLPIHQSIRFELVINLKTAKTLGIKISDNMLSLADEVIE
jgi:putative ABC transport system substrate-binding protein